MSMSPNDYVEQDQQFLAADLVDAIRIHRSTSRPVEDDPYSIGFHRGSS